VPGSVDQIMCTTMKLVQAAPVGNHRTVIIIVNAEQVEHFFFLHLDAASEISVFRPSFC